MSELVWSYSMLDMFETCPRKWHDKYILKNKEPETEALRYGNYVHKSLENALKGAELPQDLHKHLPLVRSIANAPGRLETELKLGVNKDLHQCAFFGGAVWGRGAADVMKMQMEHAFLGDWKTGKRRDKEDQLKILSMLLFKNYPKLKRVVACNLWLQTNEIGDVYEFERDKEPGMWATLLPRLQKMYAAVGTSRAEVMTPGPLCGWCPVKICRFNKS